MVELLFVACLGLGSPTCEEKSLIYIDMPLQACLVQAQGELAGWTEQHPEWSIRRWSCRSVDQGASDA
jgi:hypothetical protein